MQVAVFAKAPQAGFVKTRLIGKLGANGAARLQRQLTLRTVMMAQQLTGARVTLWCAPDDRHRSFRALARRFGIATTVQNGDDLGGRMANAFARCEGPALLIGCDCPALEAAHLARCAQLLQSGLDAVFIPAEDGGYVLVGLRRPEARLFDRIDWGGEHVMAQTRTRLRELNLSWEEPATLWDIDRPADLARLASLPDWPAVADNRPSDPTA